MGAGSRAHGWGGCVSDLRAATREAWNAAVPDVNPSELFLRTGAILGIDAVFVGVDHETVPTYDVPERVLRGQGDAAGYLPITEAEQARLQAALDWSDQNAEVLPC